MRANHERTRVAVSADETDPVPNAGLLPAASTVGSWLPAHEWADVRQLDAIGAAGRGSSGPVCD